MIERSDITPDDGRFPVDETPEGEIPIEAMPSHATPPGFSLFRHRLKQESFTRLEKEIVHVLHGAVQHAFSGLQQEVRALRGTVAELNCRWKEEATESELTISAKLTESLEALRAEMGEMKADSASLLNEMENLRNQSKALESASQEMARLGEKFYSDRLIQPLVKSMLPTIDLLEDTQSRYAQDSSEPAVEFSEILAAIRTMLEELLTAYGVEAFRHVRGTPFDRRFMKAIGYTNAPDNRLHLKLAESRRSGFRQGNLIVRPELVVLYQHSELPGS